MHGVQLALKLARLAVLNKHSARYLNTHLPVVQHNAAIARTAPKVVAKLCERNYSTAVLAERDEQVPWTRGIPQTNRLVITDRYMCVLAQFDL